MPTTIFKPTGGDDQPALQALLDSLPSESVVQLDGSYKLGATVTLGDTSLIGYAKATYIGALTDAYLFSANESSNMAAARLRHLDIDCAFKCRGVLLRLQRGMEPIANCHIRAAREVGLDIVNCWGSEFSHLHFRKCYGIAVRIVRSNSAELRHVTFTGCLGQGYPARDDTTVTDYGSVPVQTAHNERACVVVDTSSKGIALEHIRFESCTYGERPLVFVCGDCWHVSIKRLYLEGNANTQCRILLRGRDHNASESYMLELDGVYSQDGACEAFLRLEGRTSQALVRNYVGKGNATIVACHGGIHHDVRCERIRSWEPCIEPNKWITEHDAVLRYVSATDSTIT